MRLKDISGKLLSGSKPFLYVAFLVGLLGGLLINQKFPTRFKDEIDLVSIIQLIVTLIIALLITYYGKQQVDEKRVEKDIIIGQLRDCLTKGKEAFEDFSACCDEQEASPEQQRKIKRGNRNFSNQLLTVRKSIEYSGNQSHLVELWQQVQNQYFIFKARVTDLSQSTDFGNPNTRNQAEQAWRDLEEQLLRLIFEINKN